MGAKSPARRGGASGELVHQRARVSAVRAIQHLPQLGAAERVKSADMIRAWLRLTAQSYGRAAALAVLEEAGGWPEGCGAAPRLR